MVEFALEISPQAPPTGLTCHWTVGAGFPLAAAVKETSCPAATVWLTGLVVTDGAKYTVNVAGFEYVVVTELVKAARYSLPSSVV